MGFIIGLMIGSTLSGSPDRAHVMTALSSIPMRCLVAFDDGKDAYKKCRRLSLTLEIANQVQNTNNDYTGYRYGTMPQIVDDGMELEYRGLQMMAQAAKATPQH